jgi:phosphoribosylaminoimidazolecarboxamide formyltransferase/IMP cyclohydrolase
VDQQQKFAPLRAVAAKLVTTLRYGENPHQDAALYVSAGPYGSGIAQAQQIQGKELSYNNYNDANAALELAAEFAGGSRRCHRQARQSLRRRHQADVARSLERALACDSVSAFGGIVASNVPLDGRRPRRSARSSPRSSSHPVPMRRRARLSPRRRTCGCCSSTSFPIARRAARPIRHRRRSPRPGPRQTATITRDMLKVVTKRQPTEQELEDCLFAWTVAKHVKSNAIVYAKDGVTAASARAR